MPIGHLTPSECEEVNLMTDSTSTISCGFLILSSFTVTPIQMEYQMTDRIA